MFSIATKSLQAPAAGIPLTLLEKHGGEPLSKRIAPGDDGKPVSDGSPCAMSHGTAERVRLNGSRPAADLTAMITGLGSHQALAIGDLADGLPDKIQIELAARADPAHGTYGRTKENLVFREGEPAPVLLDYDRKGMPPETKARIDASGGVEGVLASIIPGYARLARVVRASTSAGIVNTATGEQFPGSGGLHIYLFVKDGSDIPDFLDRLFKRSWLAGYGWIMVGRSGALLVRSIIDASVGTPERLVFEGAPLVVAPLAQDQAAREPIAHDGELLDTLAACPPLTADEQARLEALLATAKRAAKPAADAAAETAAATMARDRGIDIVEARQVVGSSLNHTLTSPHRLVFDDLGEVSVADVLSDPARFHEATLADPLEGPDYGRGKAKAYWNSDGRVLINSFAHGGGVYRLRHDFGFIEARLREAGKAAPYVLAGFAMYLDDLDPVAVDRLRTLAAKLGGVGKRVVQAAIDDVLQKTAAAAAAADPDRESAAGSAGEGRERLELNPATINQATRRCAELLADKIYMRGHHPSAVVRAGEVKPDASSEGEGDDKPDTPIRGVRYDKSSLIMVQATAGLVQYKLDEQVAFFKRGGRNQHEPSQVSCPKDLAQRLIDAATAMPLRQCSGIVTVPLFVNGEIIAEPGYHAPTGRIIAFQGPLPAIPEWPTKADALAALEVMLRPFRGYLTGPDGKREVDEHLRSTLAAAALTATVRPSLPTAPALLFDGSEPGVGKGKIARSVGVLASGKIATLIAEGFSDEETEKRFTSAMLGGSSVILFDNMTRAVCSSALESALTEGHATIRLFGKLGEDITVPLTALVMITMNNAGVRPDMLRRMLPIRLMADSETPEERKFDFDPYQEMKRDRLEILAAGFTILRAWHLSGERATKTLGSFEQWAAMVAGAVEWLIDLNPIDVIRQSKADDMRLGEEKQVFAALRALFGTGEWTAKDAAGQPAQDYRDRRNGELVPATGLDPEIWRLVLSFQGDHPSPKEVGKWLSRRKDVMQGGSRLVCRIDPHSKVAMWRIVESENIQIELNQDAILRGSRGSAGFPGGIAPEDEYKIQRGEIFNSFYPLGRRLNPAEPREPRKPPLASDPSDGEIEL